MKRNRRISIVSSRILQEVKDVSLYYFDDIYTRSGVVKKRKENNWRNKFESRDWYSSVTVHGNGRISIVPWRIGRELKDVSVGDFDEALALCIKTGSDGFFSRHVDPRSRTEEGKHHVFIDIGKNQFLRRVWKRMIDFSFFLSFFPSFFHSSPNK